MALDLAIFLLSRRWLIVNFGGATFVPGVQQVDPSVSKLQITSWTGPPW